jgi:ABC-type bacteriocin/lantibiotic exporter with double-glycine peptidase domain
MNNLTETLIYKNLNFIISNLVKPLDEGELLNHLDENKEEISDKDFFNIIETFDLNIENITLKNIDLIDSFVLPGICTYNNQDYILFQKSKDTIILLDLSSGESLNVYKKSWKKLKNIKLFIKENNKSILNKSNHWFFNILRNEIQDISKVLYITFFLTLFVFTSPLYIMSVYDRVIPTSGLETLYVLTFGVIFIYLFNYIFQKIKNNFMLRMGTNVIHKMEEFLLKKILKINPEYDNRSLSNKLIIFRDLHTIKDFFVSNTINIFLELPIFFAGLVLIGLLSDTLVFIPIFISIFIFIINFFMQKKLDFEYNKMHHIKENKQDFLIDTLNSQIDILSNNMVYKKVYNLNQIGTEQEIIGENIRRIHMNFNFLMQNLVQITTVLFIFFGTFEIIDLKMSVGYLFAFIILSNRIMQPIISINQNLLKYYEVEQSFDMINNFLKLPELDTTTKLIDLKNAPSISIQNVSFKYNRDYIFNNVNLLVNPKDSILFIGNMGAGKSTLSKILLGNYTPSEGVVSVNHFNINEINKIDYISKINNLNDNGQLFRGNVYENIDIKNKYSLDKLLEIIEKKGLSFLINNDKNLLNFQVDNLGRNISNGQKQIILLLRTFIYDSNFIILDEPLMNLHPGVKQKFINFLIEYKKDKTLIIFSNEPDIYLHFNVINRLMRIDEQKIIEIQKEK